MKADPKYIVMTSLIDQPLLQTILNSYAEKGWLVHTMTAYQGTHPSVLILLERSR